MSPTDTDTDDLLKTIEDRKRTIHRNQLLRLIGECTVRIHRSGDLASDTIHRALREALDMIDALDSEHLEDL